ncbi:MAG: hypothetical protein RLY11_722 [Bacteroidota bacterium]|jgi:glycerate 2-kinase|nr:glycerate kinase [Chitinophagia bacterium]
MKIIIAPDKFKGSIDSISLCNAIRKEIVSLYPEAEVLEFPLADGGDGFSQIIQHYFGTASVATQTTDPLGRAIVAKYQYAAASNTAFIEMASASGLALLSSEERNPYKTSTYGTGLLIRDAIRRGATHIILGIGGSATTDGGIGMADALGYMFLDEQGDPLEPCGENLSLIHEIVFPESDFLENIQFTIACDVKNPLCGPTGAAFVYGPQKGATPEQVVKLDEGLAHLDTLFMKFFTRSVADVPGAGAAGGLGAGCEIFLGARLLPGTQYIIDHIDLETHIASADFIITGEGMVDEQSVQGKVVGHVASIAKKHQKPVHVICGQHEKSDAHLFLLDKVVTLSSFADSVEASINDPLRYIPSAVKNIL